MAEGKAQALLVQQQALASSIDILNKSTPNQQVLLLRSLETMEKVADGNATKIIIPSNLQNLVGSFATLGEVFKETTAVGTKQKNDNFGTDVISVKPKPKK